ncbi:hypothetical protein ACOSQ3_031819 [Xanthoceras sorbifolium]
MCSRHGHVDHNYWATVKPISSIYWSDIPSMSTYLRIIVTNDNDLRSTSLMLTTLGHILCRYHLELLSQTTMTFDRHLVLTPMSTLPQIIVTNDDDLSSTSFINLLLDHHRK